jgi:segregation and condensation protein B
MQQLFSSPANDNNPCPTVENILLAALLVGKEPLTLAAMQALFPDGFHADEVIDEARLTQALATLRAQSLNLPWEIVESIAGFRLQVKKTYLPWLHREESLRPARTSQAFWEILALIAYRQPITRGEIEAVRGVAVNPNILKTLQEQDWITVLGHKESPGRPALWGTTPRFLQAFALTDISQLPTTPLQDLALPAATETLPPSAATTEIPPTSS